MTKHERLVRIPAESTGSDVASTCTLAPYEVGTIRQATDRRLRHIGLKVRATARSRPRALAEQCALCTHPHVRSRQCTTRRIRSVSAKRGGWRTRFAFGGRIPSGGLNPRGTPRMPYARARAVRYGPSASNTPSNTPSMKESGAANRHEHGARLLAGGIDSPRKVGHDDESGPGRCASGRADAERR